MDTGYYISKKDYDTIINYATAAYETMKAEIGGMSICYQDEDGDWIVTDPVILKQKVTGSTCDLDQDALADYYCKAAKKHGKKNFRFCWWHSHHTMGVFWSGTDIKGINEYSDGDLSFALVVNLKRENKFRASMWQPVVMHEDTTLEILENKGSSVPKKILEEVEKLCEKPAYTYTSWKDKKKDDKSQTNMWDDDIYGGLIQKVGNITPFIFEQRTDVDGAGINGNDATNEHLHRNMTLCKFGQKGFSFTQQAPFLYSTKLKLVEIW